MDNNQEKNHRPTVLSGLIQDKTTRDKSIEQGVCKKFQGRGKGIFYTPENLINKNRDNNSIGETPTVKYDELDIKHDSRPNNID